MPALSRSVAEAARLPARSPFAGEAAGQLLRFAIGGAGVTLFAAAIYLAVATTPGMPPLVANTISTGCGVVVGYRVHSRWSFRADAAGAGAAMIVRFLIGAAVAFALNSFWVWLAVHALHLPAWTPVTGMVFATPLASFALNRWWVFA